MASLSPLPNSGWLLQFTVDYERRSLRFEKMSRKNAEGVRGHIERILAAQQFGGILEAATQEWLLSVPEKFKARMRRAGLLGSREVLTLGQWTQLYIDQREDLGPTTKERLTYARTLLFLKFKENQPLNSITPGDADQYRNFLSNRFGDNTVRRQCARVKQFFRAAVRRKLITENPFGDMKNLTVRANKARDYFVTEAEAKTVLAACANTRWRLMFALARWGGLRIPSEATSLAWSDINFVEKRFVVRSPKTKRYQSGIRVVPLFPELLEHFEDMRELAPEFDPQKPETSLVFGGKPLNQQKLPEVIAKAGIKPWTKVWMNLRATRATELAATHPEHVVVAWLGHTPQVAREHYLRVTEMDFERATAKATESAAKSAAPRCKKRGTKSDSDAQQHTSGNYGKP
jgi:integrase